MVLVQKRFLAEQHGEDRANRSDKTAATGRPGPGLPWRHLRYDAACRRNANVSVPRVSASIRSSRKCNGALRRRNRTSRSTTAHGVELKP
jgi:hypothetical protein